jgi:hypothetical protein
MRSVRDIEPHKWMPQLRRTLGERARERERQREKEKKCNADVRISETQKKTLWVVKEQRHEECRLL